MDLWRTVYMFEYIFQWSLATRDKIRQSCISAACWKQRPTDSSKWGCALAMQEDVTQSRPTTFKDNGSSSTFQLSVKQLELVLSAIVSSSSGGYHRRLWLLLAAAHDWLNDWIYWTRLCIFLRNWVHLTWITIVKKSHFTTTRLTGAYGT